MSEEGVRVVGVVELRVHRDALRWVTGERCDACGADGRLCLAADNSGDEFGPVVVCRACLQEALASTREYDDAGRHAPCRGTGWRQATDDGGQLVEGARVPCTCPDGVAEGAP